MLAKAQPTLTSVVMNAAPVRRLMEEAQEAVQGHRKLQIFPGGDDPFAAVRVFVSIPAMPPMPGEPCAHLLIRHKKTTQAYTQWTVTYPKGRRGWNPYYVKPTKA